MSTRSDSRTVLVTGSSRGIGKEIALQFASNNTEIVVNYVNSVDNAKNVVDSVENLGADGLEIRADVSDRRSVEKMRSRIHDHFGPIDVLINNAGVKRDAKFKDISQEEWEKVIDVNLTGPFITSQIFLEDIKGSPAGRIINISSVVAQKGNVGQANYAASKSGLIGLTKTLAKEVSGTNTTVNCVAPGFTKTSMLEEIPDRIKRNILQTIPGNRFADREEIASGVIYLASEQASYVNGEVLNIDNLIKL